MPRLELVEPRGEPLGAVGHRAVLLLALRDAVLLFGGPAPSPLARFSPLLLGDLPLEVGEGTWERHHPCFCPVRETPPFRPAGAWLLRRNLCPFVGLFVASYTLVGRAPSDLDDDTRPRLSQCGDVLPYLEGVLLSRAQLV